MNANTWAIIIGVGCLVTGIILNYAWFRQADRFGKEEDPNTNFSGKPQEFGGCYHDTKKEMTKQEWRTI